MKISQITPAELVPNPWNTNVCSPEAIEKITASLKRHGWVKPVIARQLADGSLQILGGQHRVEVAMTMGLKTVPVVDLGTMDDTRAKEIGLIDNARYGSDDADSLAELLDDLGGAAVVGEFLPFSDEELAALSTSVDIDLDDLGLKGDDDAPPEREKRPAKTHQMMRFKVPLEDADLVTEIIEEIQAEQGFEDGDSLTNAGDALVWLVSQLKEAGQ